MVQISCKNIMKWIYLTIAITISLSFDTTSANRDGYYGKFIGKLTEFHHGVSGEVYAVDARTLHLRNFNYDGEGPAAYFYVGNSKGPGVNGIRIRDERGTTNVLPRYRNKHITLTLPEGKTLQNIRWFSVWCDEFSVNFGDVRIAKNFDFPRPQKINGLSGVHGVSSDPIVIVDAQTLLIPNFSYDGEAPDAKFWVGRGFKPSPQGIRLPDENGKYNPLRLYDRKTIVLTLPGDMTVFDIGHFGVWCEAFTVDFGHVQIPSGLNVPPSLKMLGVSPQKRSRSLAVPLNAQNQFENQFGGQEPAEQNVNNPIFYQDFRTQTNAFQDIRPTTYRPQTFRHVQQRINNVNFDIQRSISLPSNNEYIINEKTGDFVKKPLEIQHSRRQEIRYEPTPAEKILQHNPAEPDSQSIYQNNGFLYTPQTPQTVTLQPPRSFITQPVQQQQQQQPILVTPSTLRPFFQNHQPQMLQQRASQQFLQQPLHHFIQQPIEHQFIQQQATRPSQFVHSQEQNIFQQQQRQQFLHQPQHHLFQQQPFLQSNNAFGQRTTNHFGSIFQQQQVSKLNCEVLWDQLAYEVRWAVAGDSIVLQLVAKLENGEYMSFGLSGDGSKSQMVGGDVTVAWVDKDTLRGHAYDYYLDAKSQCSGGRGSCPDEKIAERTNSVRLLNAALVNGYSIVTYQRSLKPQDELDHQIYTNVSQPIIWAIGPLNSLQEVSYHSLVNRGNVFIDFGRSPKWNCPTPESNSQQSDAEESPSNSHDIQPAQYAKQQRVSLDAGQQGASRQETHSRPQVPTPAPAPKTDAWEIPAIQCHEPEDGVFYAQMGPTGGKRGYSAITGHVGWGVSWYINGLLIPEINVVRGRTYTFIVEGGLDPEIPARYHPFYITDDPVGGYEHKTPEERANIQIFAGAVQNKRGDVRPTGVGRLCNWTPDPKQPPASEFASFGAYQRTLRLECDQGEPGIIQWTVDRDTPDTVYYQCYTHRYLGWKINVLDHCDTEGAGSNPVPSIVKPPPEFFERHSDEFDDEAQESIIHATKIKPDFESKKSGGKTREKNQTQSFANDFVKRKPLITYVPEFTFYNEETGETLSPEALSKIKTKEEIAYLKAQYALKDPLIKLQTIQHGEPQLFHPRQPQVVHKRPEVHVSKPQQKIIPLDLQNMKDDEFLNLFHISKPQVFEIQKFKEEPPQRYQNEKIEVIVAKDHGRKVEKEIIRSPNFRIKTDLQEKPTYQIDSFRLPDELRNDEQFNEELLKNYQLLKVQAEENVKKHKQKFQIYNKPSNRLPNGQIIGGQNRLQLNVRKQPPQHAVTLQQRPLPPGMFRPPFLPPPMPKHPQKRPIAASVQNMPVFVHATTVPHRLNGVTRFPQKQISKQEPQFELQQYLALQKQLESFGSPFEVETDGQPFPKVSSIVQDKHKKNVPLAQNTGFDPDSVKVEGGFKPILNTGIAPKFNVIDRADEHAEEENDKIGVIDLTKEGELGEKEALFKDTKEELIKVEQDDDGKDESTALETKSGDDLDLFKNQKPQMFEPMFIPSPPDNRMQKHQEKHKKKPIMKHHDLGMKYRSDQLEYYNTNKNNNYVKIRPRPNLIRRPLYPDDVVPPFKIPARGGAPQFRYRQPEESPEDTTDFDVIQMNNETSGFNSNRAGNILEIIEMKESESKKNKTGNVLKIEVSIKSTGENSTEDELAMANDQRDYYLPHKVERVLTYDGKSVKTDPAPSQLLKSTPSIDISKLPQFGPFRGETPSLDFDAEEFKQITLTRTANRDILPPSSQSAKLSPVRKYDLYEPQSSEIEETIQREVAIRNESKTIEMEHGNKPSREKRSPDHVPGHVGHHDHDQDTGNDHHHDHNHHGHLPSSSSSINLLTQTFPFCMLLSVLRFF